MDADSIKENKHILDLKDLLENHAGEYNQEVIVVDGRSYENNSDKKEIFNLVDVVEDAKTADHLYEEILKRAEAIAERIARKMVPEIAERVIKEEIEKIKRGG